MTSSRLGAPAARDAPSVRGVVVWDRVMREGGVDATSPSVTSTGEAEGAIDFLYGGGSDILSRPCLKEAEACVTTECRCRAAKAAASASSDAAAAMTGGGGARREQRVAGAVIGGRMAGR